MKGEECKALFLLAGIKVLCMWELPNGYWPPAYVYLRKDNPWWLVKTPRGLVKIGMCKRVMSIDWSDTDIRAIITEDETTKSETDVHAWSRTKVLEYLTELGSQINSKDRTNEHN